TADHRSARAATRFPAWVIIAAPSFSASRSAVLGPGFGSRGSCRASVGEGSGGRNVTTPGGAGSVARRKPGGRVSLMGRSVVRLYRTSVPRRGEDLSPRCVV